MIPPVPAKWEKYLKNYGMSYYRNVKMIAIPENVGLPLLDVLKNLWKNVKLFHARPGRPCGFRKSYSCRRAASGYQRKNL
jgi:hypothetical protein